MMGWHAAAVQQATLPLHVVIGDSPVKRRAVTALFVAHDFAGRASAYAERSAERAPPGRNHGGRGDVRIERSIGPRARVFKCPKTGYLRSISGVGSDRLILGLGLVAGGTQPPTVCDLCHSLGRRNKGSAEFRAFSSHPPFHGGNRGSNPLGDANYISMLAPPTVSRLCPARREAVHLGHQTDSLDSVRGAGPAFRRSAQVRRTMRCRQRQLGAHRWKKCVRTSRARRNSFRWRFCGEMARALGVDAPDDITRLHGILNHPGSYAQIAAFFDKRGIPAAGQRAALKELQKSLEKPLRLIEQLD